MTTWRLRRRTRSSGPTYCHRDFRNTVLPAELDEIRQRREAAGIERSGIVESNLAGLSLSGGGVRSATFCLGVVQAFVKAGLYKEFDYLSTVSGGGYIGSTLSSSLIGSGQTPARYSDPPILRASDTNSEDEAAVVQHLRNHSKYLAPTGKSTVLAVPALMLLGLTTNILLTLPTLIVFSFLIKATSFVGRVSHATVLIVAIFAIWTALYAAVVSNTAQSANQWVSRKNWLAATVFLIGGLTLFIFLNLQPDAVDMVKTVLETKLTDAISWTLGSLGAVGVFVGLIGYVMNKFGRLASRVWRVAIGLAAPAALWFVVLAIVSTLYDPCAWHTFERYTGLPIASTFRPFADSHRYLNLAYDSPCFIPDPTDANKIETMLIEARDFYTVCAFYLVAFVILLILAFLTNVNATSLHAFYRDRLRDAYIWHAEKGADPKLSELPSRAPYHILNAAINIQNSTQNLRGRDAQTFFFSKLFCGSSITGWCLTESLEAADSQINLAAAMAISGAAVAPNQGVTTNRPLRFLMALANARLGYWLINPSWLLSGSKVGRRVSPYFFLLELLGRLDETRKRVYISDGGHIENLGAYELLRRRCKFIVIVDSEQDTSNSFHGLAHFVRIAKIDFDYEIDFTMADIRRNELGVSKAHCALGSVRYGASQYGSILYIKASLTGDENEYINEYKKRVKEFPHESTTDQFFTEEQFEAYRALGFHIGDGLVRGYAGGIEEFFAHLQDVLVIDVLDKDAYLKVQRRIMRIRKMLAEERSKPRSDTQDAQEATALLMEQKVQLMEFAVLKLKLNQEYVAVGPCRNIAAVFSDWMKEKQFGDFWRREAARFGDDLRLFVHKYSEFPSPGDVALVEPHLAVAG
jgi:hypothetical protein